MDQNNERAYVELNMLQTIDGKATGSFWGKPSVRAGCFDSYSVMDELNPDAFALGRVTMQEMYCIPLPNLSKYKNKKISHQEDFVVPLEKGVKKYFVAYDRKGTLGYKSNIINTMEWLGDKTKKKLCQIIEVLSENVNDEYLAYCKDMGISYIFAGKKEINIEVSLQKLKKLFGINKLQLQGGPKLDGSFIKNDFIDAISIIIAPLTAKGGEPLFTPSENVDFKLIKTKVYSEGNVWLYYEKVK